MTAALLNNRYRIIRALGTGGFGETFLAEDTHTPSRRTCVIKQLKPISKNPEVTRLVQERFGREAAILEQLGEGNAQIPRLYAYFAEQGQFYLVQEWVQGVTLNELVQQEGVLEESSVKQILASLLAVLDYLHARGIIHRDIKPSNIILRQQDSKPVLIDFGIAKEIVNTIVDGGGEITSSIAVGTLGYMPPEQAAGKPVYASDIYSLALTAIYLLTGKRPQDLDTNLQTGEMTWRRDNLNISSSFAAVLSKATLLHPSDRYSTAKEMLAALQLSPRTFPQLPETVPPEETLPILKPETIDAKKPESPPVVPPNPRIPEPEISLSRQEYRDRQILLNKVKNYWIKGVLETSLHGKALIELGLSEQLDAIERPWGLVWETPDLSQQPLPPGTKIIDKFDELGAGRTLLILGDPGSGKTTTLLELARDLITRAEQHISQPIPVVFNLSSWAGDKQTIAAWLVQELNTKYQVSQEIGQTWIKDQVIILMLDGLDEVSSDRRDLCVQAINKFSQEYGQTEMVVASRIKDYQNLSHRLKLQGAICLQPLTLKQIHQYLASASGELAAVNAALQEDSTLQELAKSPLMLSIMTLAYRGMSLASLPRMTSIEERRQHLFNAYIERMFKRRGAEEQYSKQQAMSWLIWLAEEMVKQSQTVFLIERMQPIWLPKKHQKGLYALNIGLMAGLSAGLGGGLIAGHAAGLYIGLTVGLIIALGSGLGAGLVFGLISDRINPVETLQWSWKKARDNIKQGVVVGAIAGLILGLSSGLVSGLIFNVGSGLVDAIFTGITDGLGASLIFVLLRGLSGPGISTSTIPNQGIWQSAKNAMLFALTGMVGLSLVAIVMAIPIFWGLVIGLVFGLFGAGEACVKHFALRLILYCNGYIPWNYARFLDWATERIFLQKVGGGYIFIHRLLLEHFAQL
ncbi:protein kinase [Microcoleus sp. FACHB-831]|uniref:protein kinase domain-containing protein n=1 Tax=Microcoleus sp. FACHB-831 TaxID=2692827 RepID=UPI0016861E20|nr:protein kinase [Microcoleus sp. FACHB-831]MBD1922988.1 protein kinase [Microcoleus sp. FACHB-831]